MQRDLFNLSRYYNSALEKSNLTLHTLHFLQELLRVLEVVNDEKERNSLIVAIALLQPPSSALLSRIEALVQSPSFADTDPLLLAYGALADKASPEVQGRIVQFLQHRMSTLNDSKPALVHLLHSLGNTGCESAIDIILPYLFHLDEDVQFVAISAVRKASHSRAVVRAFHALVRSLGLTLEQTENIISALLLGLDHDNSRDMDDLLPLLSTLASKVIAFNNSDLHELWSQYVLSLANTEPGHKERLKAMVVDEDELLRNVRQQRDSNWAERNKVYDLVSSYQARIRDVAKYQRHEAFIWGSKAGVSDLHVKLAAGGFAGISKDCNAKLFGKAVVKGYVFGHSKKAFSAEIRVERDGITYQAKLYAELLGHVLVNYDVSESCNCSVSKAWPLYESAVYPLFSFTHSVFIYVGFLHFTVGMDVQLGVNAGTEYHVTSSTATARAFIVIQTTLTAHGSASASIAVSLHSAACKYTRADTLPIAPCFLVRNLLRLELPSVLLWFTS